MTPKLKKIIVALLVLAVCFVAYVVFLRPDPSAEVLVSGGGFGAPSAPLSEEARLLGVQITQALLRVQQIKLDKSLFSNPVFVSLEDRSTEILNEPEGRTNPFAPLSDTSVNVSSRSQLNATTTPVADTQTSATSTSTSTTTPVRTTTTPSAPSATQ